MTKPPKTKPQPNVLFEATVRRMLAGPPHIRTPMVPIKKKATAKGTKKRAK